MAEVTTATVLFTDLVDSTPLAIRVNAVRSLPEERAGEIAARTLARPDAQSVEDLTALLTPAGER